MAFSGSQITRLGQAGFPRQKHGSFSGKTEAVAIVRQALTADDRDFALVAGIRDFSLTADDRDFTLTARS